MEPSKWLGRNPIRLLCCQSLVLLVLVVFVGFTVISFTQKQIAPMYCKRPSLGRNLTMSLTHPRQVPATLHEVFSQLQVQITEFQTLLPLLCLPLARVNLLPPQFRRFNSLPSEDVRVDIAKVFPPIQRILLESILPTWETILEEEGCSALTRQYFCPDAFSNASAPAGDVALFAYSTILSLPLHQRCVDLLLRLAKEYPIDRLFRAVCTIRDPARRSVSWDDCLRNTFAVPTKMANAFRGQDIPVGLGLPDYYNNLSIRTELLIYFLSTHGLAGQYFVTELFGP